MKREHKDLLLKDLYARLPYGVRVNYKGEIYDVCGISHGRLVLCKPFMSQTLEYCPLVEEVEPYLFPILSMTDKQKEELFFSYIHNDIYFDDFTDYFLAGELWHDICVSLDILPDLIDWFNKHHIDWRGLIPKKLAKDATGKNIY